MEHDAKDAEIARLRKENEVLRHELLSGNKSIAMYWINVGMSMVESSTDLRSLAKLRALEWVRSHIDGTNPFLGDANERPLQQILEEGINDGA